MGKLMAENEAQTNYIGVWVSKIRKVGGGKDEEGDL